MTKEKEQKIKQKLIEMNNWNDVEPEDLDIEMKNGKLVCRFKKPVELTFISAEGE